MNDLNVPIQQLDRLIQQFTGGKADLKDGIVQTIALLAASSGMARTIAQSSETGVLNVSSARVSDIYHVTAVGDNYAYQGPDKQTTEVIIMGHPSNAGLVWVRTDIAATTGNAWPLGAKEGIQLSINNLKELRLLIASDTEKAIVLYTR